MTLVAAGVVDTFVKMLTSLALVLAIIAVAYFVMKRRAGVAGRAFGNAGRGSRSAARTGRRPVGRTGALRSPRGGRRSSRQPIEVLGRVGLTRSSSAVALKFGDRVVLVGASEQAQPVVLAELDAATWELYDTEAEWTVPADVGDDDLPTARPGFVAALREATVRRV